MFSSIIDMFITIFAECASWLSGLMESTGMLSLWLGAFVIWATFRTLLKPLFGIAGSDSAKRRKPSDDETEV